MLKTKGGVYVALLMLVMILFINANPSRATSPVLKMSNNSGCSSFHDCLIADDQSLEFLLGSEADTISTFDIQNTYYGVKPAVYCRPGRNYKSCLPDPRASKIGERCNNYLYRTRNRGCI